MYSSNRSIAQILFCNIKKFSNYHKPSDLPNIFIFSSPRSGSEWLMNIIASQPGIKHCSEIFNLRRPVNCWYLGINNWNELYEEKNKEDFINKLKLQINGNFNSGSVNPRPFNKFYSYFTNRIVFKIHFGGEDIVNVFKDRLNGKIVYLLRHPIPVSISRKVLPKLKTYIESDFNNYLTNKEITFAKSLVNEGDPLKCAVLDWCLQNKAIINQIKKDWIIVTYEQLVVDPLPIINLLMTALSLTNQEKMINNLFLPSKTVYEKESKIKHQIMKSKIYKDKLILLEKWKEEINNDTEKELMDILKIFKIDYYKYNDIMPKQKLWVS